MTRPGDALYRLLLRAFPPSFRLRHGDQMLTQFRAQRAAVRGRPVALLKLWARAIADALAHGLSVRRELAARDRRPRANLVGAGLRDAARRLRRDRGVTAVIVAILAVGIAATTIMFGVVDQLLLRPPAGVGHAAAVRRVHYASTEPRPGQTVAERHGYPIAAAIRDSVASFAAAAATHLTDVTLGGGADARQVTAQLVDANYFDLLELQPSAGRFFAAGSTPEPLAVLSHGLWRRAFANDPAIVGRQLRVENVPLVVAGIAPAGFKGLENRPIDIWVPTPVLAPAILGAQWATNANRYAFSLIARLRPDATPAAADQQATAALLRELEQHPQPPQLGRAWMAFTAPLHRLRAPNGISAEGKVGLWLLGVASAVLIVAIANVVSLLLTRAVSRRREIALRIALGAGRARLLRQEFAESALLTAIAAIAALALTWAGRRFVERVLLPNFAWSESIIDFRVLAATLAIALVTALTAGLAPALYATSTDALTALRTAPRGGSRRTGWFRSGLLVSQLALSVVLLIGAGLFVRSLGALRGHDVGIDLDRVILTTLPDRLTTVMTGLEPLAAIDALYADAAARIAALPAVDRVAVARASAPLSMSQATMVLRDGWTLSDLKGRTVPAFTVAGPGFFETLGATIERGRGLTADDEREQALVVVINRTLAAGFWSDVDPLGQCVRFGRPPAPCSTIVGIVEDVLSYDRADTGQPQIYLLPSHPAVAGARPRALFVRTRGDAAAAVPAVQQVVRSLRPDMPFVAVTTLAERVEPQLQPWRLGSSMFMLFGFIALVIAAVGLFSAMAYAVSQQSHEIGIRLALGASAWHVVARVCRRGAATVAAGTALGLLLAWLLSNQIAGLLYQTSPTDSFVFATVAVVLALAGLVAAIVPARRSAIVDPLIVLKSE